MVVGAAIVICCMSETQSENHEAMDIAWTRLTLALGGLALAADSVVNYSEGKLWSGLTESAMGGGVLLASYLMRRRQ